MNQVSQVSFGPDATQHQAYVLNGNERLGNLDLVIENTDSSATLVFIPKVQSTLTPSGFANVSSPVSIVPRGVKTISLNLLGKKLGLFGSGQDSSGRAVSVTANVSAVIRNKGDLRGAQLDIVNVGRRGWGYDKGFNKASTGLRWGTPPDQPTNTESNNYGGTAGGGGV